MTTWVVVGIMAALAVLFAYWLFTYTEGVYLGQRVVIGLYDLYAKRYDRIKQFDERADFAHLTAPLMKALQPYNDPLVLDAATGTGRLPLALCRHPNFEGHIIGVDLSHKMLGNAAEKLTQHRDQITLLSAPAEQLPFPNHLFDVVSCLEALEFTPSPADTLRELIRVLRPGGILLTTNRINARLMPGKVWTDERLITLLQSAGVVDVVVELWQEDYKKVWGRKAGGSAFTGAILLDGLLHCPVCEASMEQFGEQWVCRACDAQVLIQPNGVVNWMRPTRLI